MQQSTRELTIFRETARRIWPVFSPMGHLIQNWCKLSTTRLRP